MRNVLVTGVTGLIGGHLVRHLAGRYDVHAVARRPLNVDGVTSHVVDLASPGALAGLPERVDAVIHLAQSRHYRDYPDSAADIFDINVASTARLLDWGRAHGATSFVYASSGGVYGHGEDSFREDEPALPPEPLGYYLATKRSAELLIAPYAQFMSTVILRFFFVYGTGQGENMLVPRLIHSVREGVAVTLQGADGIRLNPVHVSDAVQAIEHTLDLTGLHHINIAGPETLTLREMTDAIGRCVGREPVYDVTDEQPRHLTADITKMRRLLVAPQVTFETGVRELCEPPRGE